MQQAKILFSEPKIREPANNNTMYTKSLSDSSNYITDNYNSKKQHDIIRDLKKQLEIEEKKLEIADEIKRMKQKHHQANAMWKNDVSRTKVSKF